MNWTYVRFYAWREFYFYYTPKRHVSGLSGRFHLHRLAALAHSSFYSQLASRAAVGVHPYGQGFTAKLEVPKQRCNFHAIICTASLSTLGSTHHLTPTASAEKHVVAKRSIAKRLLCLESQELLLLCCRHCTGLKLVSSVEPHNGAPSSITPRTAREMLSPSFSNLKYPGQN